MRHVLLGSLFVGLLTTVASVATAVPHHRPPPPVVEAPPSVPTGPEIVPQAPSGSSAFGAVGEGPQIWFVLPSCRPSQPDDPRDYCPIERLEVTAIHGAVLAGPMTTVMDGAVPRRVQAFATAAGTDLLRVRLISPDGLTRFEAVVPVRGLGDLAAPAGRPTPTGFTIDFTQYPGR